jgi:hypothetical protein
MWGISTNGTKQDALNQISEQVSSQSVGIDPDEAKAMRAAAQHATSIIELAEGDASISFSASGSSGRGEHGKSYYLSMSLSVAALPPAEARGEVTDPNDR